MYLINLIIKYHCKKCIVIVRFHDANMTYFCTRTHPYNDKKNNIIQQIMEQIDYNLTDPRGNKIK